MDDQQQKFLNEIKQDWKDLQKTLVDYTGKYSTELANINTKLKDFRPKSFLRTGGFYLGMAPIVIFALFVLWGFVNHECVTYKGELYGFCEAQKISG